MARPIRLYKPIGSVSPSGQALPGKGFYIDTRPAVALANQMKAEAARARVAIVAANEKLANEFQVAEANELRKQVKEQGRPQRHNQKNSPIDKALRSKQNRRVYAERFEVNVEDYLDKTVIYWRQLEHGWMGRTTIYPGLFLDPRARNSGGRFQRKGVGGAYARPDRASRSAYKLAQFAGGIPIKSAIGPRVAMRYIETTSERKRKEWTSTRHVPNVYRRTFQEHGLDLMAQFKSQGRTFKGFNPLG